MKRLLSALAVGLFLVAQAAPSFAVTKTYTLSASVPVATGVSFTASRVDAVSGTFTTVSGTTLSFDPMVFNTTNQIWLPDHYFALDIAASGGAGSTDATFTYAEGSNPNSPSIDLGWKASATFVRVNGTTETALTGHGTGGKRLLKDLNGEHITPTELAGGRLRTYLGVNTGDTTTPTGGEVFSNADRAGTYTGTLTISVTVA